MSAEFDGPSPLAASLQFLERLPAPGWVRRRGRYLYVNAQWERRFGQEADSVVGRADSELYGPEIGARRGANDRRAVALGRPTEDLETVGPGPAQEWLVIRVPYEDPGGPLVCGFALDPTERQHAERLLRAREAQLAEAQRIASIGSWSLSPGSGLHWSDEMYRLMGIEVGTEPLREAFHAIVHPSDLDRLRAGEAEAIRSDLARFEVEYRIIRPTHEIRHIQAIADIDRASDGSVRRVIGVAHDITDRRAAELAVRASQAMLEAIHRAQTQFIGDLDPRPSFNSLLHVLLAVTQSEYGFVGEVFKDGKGLPFMRTFAITDISWNEETRRMYSENAARGLEFRNLATLFGRVMTSRQAVIANAPAAHPASGGLPPGHPAMSAFLGLPLLYGDELVGMVGIANRPDGYDEALCRLLEPFLTTSATMVNAHRIERRRQEAEEGLVTREEQLRTLVEQASDGIFVTDRTGRTLDVNGIGARMVGMSRDEVIGAPIAELLDPVEHVRLGHELAQLDEGKTIVGDWDFLRKDGTTFTGEVSAKRLSDGRLQRIVRDVSERKRAELAKEQLEAQLRQSQKMEAVGTLAGGIAHDFNNILSAIIANTQLLELDPSAPSARASAQEVLAACRRAKELVQRILAFGRRQDPSMRSIDLGPVVDEALQLLRSTIPAGVELRRLGPASLPPVLADDSQVHQVVMNLVNNAWYALGGRAGWIRTRLGVSTLSGHEALPHRDLRPGDWVVLEVSDNGRGMSPETIQRIFEPFFTTKPVGEGTGLGLSVVHGIVQAHQGVITVESVGGEGSVFRAWFPVMEGGPHRPAMVQTAPSAKGNGQRVLFVDDELALVNVAQRWFQRFGFHVTSCARPDDALERFRTGPGEYDLVITDLSMPGMSGLELARAILQIRPGMPIVLASGHLSQEQHDAARSLGISVLAKPYTLDDLARCVTRV